MDYDLNRLGWREFEHLTQALFKKIFGASSTAFGDGPDGGREATFRGRATPAGCDEWDGYVVLQAKYHTNPRGGQTDQAWLRTQIQKELARWRNDKQRRGRTPDYFVVASNVALSAAPGGGLDAIDAVLGGFQDSDEKGFKGWLIWDATQLSRLLDDARDIRSAFGGLITTGDILTQLYAMLGEQGDLDNVLGAHAAKELLSDRNLRLGEAGSVTNDPLSLSEVAVDLPAVADADERPRVHVVQHILERGNNVVRPTGRNPESVQGPHVLIQGDPGQGKTTLGQLVAQAYRVAFLGDSAASFGIEVRQACDSLRAALEMEGIPEPKNRRWPIRVDLAAFADEVAGRPELGLIRWCAERVTARSAMNVKASKMERWLREWPSLLVLDGLDEVAHPVIRTTVIEKIRDLLIDISNWSADSMVVATTRPQGYAGELGGIGFELLKLQELDHDEASRYARRLAGARLRGDDEAQIATLARVNAALGEPLTSRLMRTPLQVAIMFLLLESTSRPPQDRHGLFDAYYEIIFSREVGKRGYLANLLSLRRNDVNALHEQVGLQLQLRAETAGESDASLPRGEVEQLARDRLIHEGLSDQDATKTARDLIRATTDRLVLLVAKKREHFGFEIRSLQEYMAGRALTKNLPEQDVYRRLRVLAPSAHWHNTWLFAAGRIFADHEHMRESLIALLRAVDAQDTLHQQIQLGAELAMDLLNDGIAARSPKHRRLLLEHALEQLRMPPSRHIENLTRPLVEASSDNRDVEKRILQLLRDSAGGPPAHRASAWLVLRALTRTKMALAAQADLIASSIQLSEEDKVALALWSGSTVSASRLARGGIRRLSKPFADAMRKDSLTGEAKLLTVRVVRELRQTRVQVLAGGLSLPPRSVLPAPGLIDAIRNQEVTETFALAILEIPTVDWVLAATIREQVRGAMQRQPVGDDLMRQVAATSVTNRVAHSIP